MLEHKGTFSDIADKLAECAVNLFTSFSPDTSTIDREGVAKAQVELSYAIEEAIAAIVLGGVPGPEIPEVARHWLINYDKQSIEPTGIVGSKHKVSTLANNPEDAADWFMRTFQNTLSTAYRIETIEPSEEL